MKSPLSAMLLAAGLTLGLSGPVTAQSSGETTSGGTLVTSKIVDAFTGFAGSQENAQALVAGLRSGGEITLTGSGGTGTGGRDAAGKGTTETFTSPTGPMGFGETYIALALAKDQLTSYQIDNPTPSQIAAALNGGTVNTEQYGEMQLQGVLNMRAEGTGWGRIAQVQGTKLGWVVSGLRSNGASHAGMMPTSLGAPPADPGSANGGRAAAGKGGASSGAKGITNATGENVTPGGDRGGAKGKGIVDAHSGKHGGSGSGAAHSHRGIHTALGGNVAGGHAYAFGKSKSHGGVAPAGVGHGGSAGGGIVNAGGGGYGESGAANGSSEHGAGVVSAAGVSSHGGRHRGHAFGWHRNGKHGR